MRRAWPLLVWSCAAAFSLAAIAQTTSSPSDAASAPGRLASASVKSSSTKPAAPPIQTQFRAYKVHFSTEGKEELEPASHASPGDVIEYVAQHRNVSQRRLLNVDFAIPIPWGTTLWEGSIKPADGKLHSAAKDVKNAKDHGRVIWRMERLDPGQSVDLKLRVIIDPDPTLGPAKPINPFAPRKPELRQ